MREMNSEVLIADDPLTFLRPDDLSYVVQRARASPRRRARILLHGSADEVMQEMVIVMTRGQYVPPIWNDRSPKSYLLLSGSFALVQFDSAGEITGHQHLAADDANVPFFARINQAIWHMCISVSPHVTFLETILGPHRGTVFADWAPAPDNGRAAMEFYRRICEHCAVPPDPAW